MLLGARDREGRGHRVPQVAVLLSVVCARGADGGMMRTWCSTAIRPHVTVLCVLGQPRHLCARSTQHSVEGGCRERNFAKEKLGKATIELS